MDFGNYYNMLINEFVNTSDFTILNEEEGFFNWPNSSGVYVIWEKKEFQEKELIYIGMTGKFLKNINGILNFNNAKFKSRVNRWTPYRFCENIKGVFNKLCHFILFYH